MAVFNTLFTNTIMEKCKSVVHLLVLKTSTSVGDHIKHLRKFRKYETCKMCACIYISKSELGIRSSTQFPISKARECIEKSKVLDKLYT